MDQITLTLFGTITALIVITGYYLAFGGAVYWTYRIEQWIDRQQKYDLLKGREK